MPSPLDPLNAFSKLFTAPPTTPGEFVDRWVDATTWWVEPVSKSSAELRDRMAPERLLAELIDGLLGRFGGQRLELRLRGQPVRGLLESMRVVSRDRALAVVADLADVDWAGPPLSRLQARARGVRVSPGMPASVHVAGVDVQGSCDLADVVTWAEGRTGSWVVGLDPGGRLQAEHEERSVRLTAEPTYSDGELELELRAAEWKGVELRIPRWLRITRTQPLPPLPDGMELVDAHRSGPEVWFRLALGEVSSPLDLNRLRDAIVRGAAVPVGSTDAPFTGLKVVELAVALAAPSAAVVLGDWGAEVLKVEGLTGDPQRFNTQNAYFQLDNRGKRSLSIDLKTEEGRAIFLRLLDDADVFVTNIRPAGLARLGLDPDSVAARCPRLVYAVVSGYGLDGPAADKAGYDIGAFWSRAGVAAALAGPGVEPPVLRPGMGDHTAAISLVAAVGAALFDRERTGRGRLVSTSLVRSGAWVVSSDLAADMAGEHPEPGLKRALYNPLLGCYQAGDGDWFWLLGLEATRHWPHVAAAVGREELLEDARFNSFGGLITNRDALIAILDEEFAKRPLAEWAGRFEAHDVWWDPVQDFDGVTSDPLLHAAGAFRPMEGGRTMIAPPADVGVELGEVAQAPEMGQHTEEVLLELGYDWEQIAALKEGKVIP